MKIKRLKLLSFVLALCLILTACGSSDEGSQIAITGQPPSSSLDITDTIEEPKVEPAEPKESVEDESGESKGSANDKVEKPALSISSIPSFTNSPYVVINNNIPSFTSSDYTTSSYEYYSELDSLGRCGYAIACIGIDLMPTEERGAIGQVKPTGWHTVRYDNVDGKYLYNRCHLIGFQLSGENANTKNLITGTRYLNIQGMLPFENMVADYVKETNNHVLYRVTPIFEGNNLLASGVQIEGYSVEDNGEGISFNIYAYNAQPGITIDYATGDSSASDSNSNTAEMPGDKPSENDIPENTNNHVTSTYILNTNTKKFHNPGCSSVKQMSEANKKSYSGSRDDLISQGYEPCKRCNP